MAERTNGIAKGLTEMMGLAPKMLFRFELSMPLLTIVEMIRP